MLRIALTSVMALALMCAVCAADGQRHPGHDVVWSQTPVDTMTGLASQQAPDGPWSAESAADFELAEECDILHVHWWGSGLIAPPRKDGPALTLQRVDWNGNPLGRALDCSGATPLGCGSNVSDDTTGGATNVDYYDCIGWLEDGPEHVYRLIVPANDTPVDVVLTTGGADLDVFLLADCDENSCITYGSTGLSAVLAAGTYYLVVDGYHGAADTYTIDVTCTGVAATNFVVRFYESIPAPARSGMPGDLLYEHFLDDAHQVQSSSAFFSYWADIPPFHALPGVQYWISIQAIADYATYGQWFWTSHEPVELDGAFMDFEYLGVPRWTPFTTIGYGHLDLAFELSTIDSPVESKSWGTIKALYR